MKILLEILMKIFTKILIQNFTKLKSVILYYTTKNEILNIYRIIYLINSKNNNQLLAIIFTQKKEEK